MTQVRLLVGDCRDVLPEKVATGSLQTVVTSPPYYHQRDNGLGAEQIGLEATPRLFVERLVSAFAPVRSALRDDGTLWVVLDDSYMRDNKGIGGASAKQDSNAGSRFRPPKITSGFTNKQLFGIPWRFALAMQDAGWTLRCDVIWEKPNAYPETARDRPTRSHEYVFLFSKTDRYWFDETALLEPGVDGDPRRPRSVWRINTEPPPWPHYSAFPRELARRCLVATARPGDWVCDLFSGSGTVGAVAVELGMHVVLVEQNPATAERSRARLVGALPLLIDWRP